jgi:hypothetical protein
LWQLKVLSSTDFPGRVTLPEANVQIGSEIPGPIIRRSMVTIGDNSSNESLFQK